MRRLILWLSLAAALTGCGGPGPDQLAPGPRAVVAQVRSGDIVTLKGGQVVRLAGIETPRLGEPYSDQARADLSRLVLGREVQLLYGGARQDAYGRVLAHLRLTQGRVWVQQALLRAGDARVHTYADNRALARAMLDEEARARQAGRGLWGLSDYQVRLPDEAAARPFDFQIVEGRVTAVLDEDGGPRLDLERWVEADVPRSSAGSFTAAGVALDDLAGKLIRVRGVLRPGSGQAVMRLDHPEQIEVLKAQ
jgi:endonuclease YncB( thermonuclease family)